MRLNNEKYSPQMCCYNLMFFLHRGVFVCQFYKVNSTCTFSFFLIAFATVSNHNPICRVQLPPPLPGAVFVNKKVHYEVPKNDFKKIHFHTILMALGWAVKSKIKPKIKPIGNAFAGYAIYDGRSVGHTCNS